MNKDDMFSVVYNHIKGDYETMERTMYGFVPNQDKEMIRNEAMQETFKMVRNGNIKEYYARIKNNAI